MNRYIRSLDNHQRRQLVDQPRDIISQYMLNHLVQENQTARARQLTSLRFRVNSTELEMTSRTDTHVVLSEELVEHFKELLAQNNEEPASTTLVRKPNATEPEEEEIQVIEPPPKTPPLCIDLDEESSSPAPSSSTADKSKTSQAVKQSNSNGIAVGARPDNLSSARSVSSASEAPLQTPVNTSHNSSSAVSVLQTPLNSSLGVGTSSENLSKTSDAKKKETRLNEKRKKKEEEHKSRMEMLAMEKAKVDAAKLANQQKKLMGAENKKKRRHEKREKKRQTPTNSPPHLPTNQVPVQPQGTAPVEIPLPVQPTVPIQPPATVSVPTPVKALEASANKELVVVSVMETANVSALNSESQKNSDSDQPQSSLKILLDNLAIEEQEGKARIAVIDRNIEDLQLERKNMIDRVLALKQKQFDLLRSSFTATPFDIDGKEKQKVTTNCCYCLKFKCFTFSLFF